MTSLAKQRRAAPAASLAPDVIGAACVAAGAGADVEPGTTHTGVGADAAQKRRCTKKKICICTGCCSCCALVMWLAVCVYIAFVAKRRIAGLRNPRGYEAYHPDNSLITIHDVLAYEKWPGCEGTAGNSLSAAPNFTNCGAVCCKCAMVPSYRSFNSQSSYAPINFTSRAGPDGQEVVQLTGWWLPVGPLGGPVVVVQHGMGSSINGKATQMAAWLLRTAGFNVVLPNLRNHGTSDAPSHDYQSWGFEYPYDLLGAWDYVVNDPDGVLGGPRNASQVGLMGFSMGGFVAASAFGLEHRAPGLWLDGAITDPKEFLRDIVKARVGFLARIYVDVPWSIMASMIDVDLRSNLPEETLPTGPGTRRPVKVVHNAQDSWVSQRMGKDFVAIMSGTDKYQVSTMFDLPGTCVANGETNNHNKIMWTEPTAYRQQLCDFWSGVFFGRGCTAPSLVF